MPAASKQTQSSLTPLLWLGGVLVAVFLLLLAARRLSPLPVEHSTPRLVHQPGGSVTVELDITSHLSQPVTRTLQVSLGRFHEGNFGSSFAVLTRQEVSVTLAPTETRHVACDFTGPLRAYPDRAEVTLLP